MTRKSLTIILAIIVVVVLVLSLSQKPEQPNDIMLDTLSTSNATSSIVMSTSTPLTK